MPEGVKGEWFSCLDTCLLKKPQHDCAMGFFKGSPCVHLGTDTLLLRRNQENCNPKWKICLGKRESRKHMILLEEADDS